jgi:hypothetical protein
MFSFSQIFSFFHFIFFIATNRRGRQTHQEFKTTRRRNSTLTATRTFRRGSQYQEIQVATLPDLSENLINESQTWEEIREIKAMPVHMAQKRELKNQLQVSFVVFMIATQIQTCRHSLKAYCIYCNINH